MNDLMVQHSISNVIEGYDGKCDDGGNSLVERIELWLSDPHGYKLEEIAEDFANDPVLASVLKMIGNFAYRLDYPSSGLLFYIINLDLQIKELTLAVTRIDLQ